MLQISLYVAWGRSSLSLGELMSDIFTLISTMFKPRYFIKREIFAPILSLMTNKCEGFHKSSLWYFSTGNELKREEIMWEKGKEGKWRRNKSPGGARRPPESKTAFHATARARMSSRLAWKPRQVVHLNKFYKGDPIEMSTEQRRAQPKPLHHHLHPQTIAAAIFITIAIFTTIALSHLVHTCNRASHKASIVRHIAINQSQDVFFNVFFSWSDLDVWVDR